MIRQLFITLLFFFGPAILTLVIRHLLLLIHIARQRRYHRDTPDIIDITPLSPGRAPRWFIVAALLIGFACAWFAWWSLADRPAAATRYIPAYVDDAGQIVPGRWESAE
ncbi:MAG: hypothetical protein Q9M13_10115 [Mariprofundales bacterium]|nr:hypothetical protein [Mariprofundales bacterium]